MGTPWKIQLGQSPLYSSYSYKDTSKRNHHIGQTLVLSNGCSIQKTRSNKVREAAPWTNALSRSQIVDAVCASAKDVSRATPVSTNNYVPLDVAFDRKVLKFYAWMREPVPDGLERVRYFEIYYHLFDDTMSIYEPVEDNSGIQQGCYLKRQKIAQNGDDGQMWNWRELNIGLEPTIYGRVFHFYNCDAFTRDFLTSEGIAVNSEEPRPTDEHRAKQLKFVVPERRICKPFDKRTEDAIYDRLVLRFWGLWDDRFNLSGELRRVVIHYYLIDETIEVKEIRTTNNGRDPVTLIQKRQKIPFEREKLMRSLPFDNLGISEKDCARFIGPIDLGIGRTIDLFCRKIFIYHCDKFTQDYYRKNFGVEDFTPIDATENTPDYAQPPVPPYNGWGSIEDSLANCYKLYPTKRLKKDVNDYFYDQQVLRFEAKLSSVWSGDEERLFHVYFYLSDNTMKIVEIHIPNSGRSGGQIMQRQKVLNPERNRPNEQYITGDPCVGPFYYESFDIYIGQKIEAIGRTFIVTNADEYVLKFVESHSNRYPTNALEDLRDMVQAYKQKLVPPVMKDAAPYKDMSENELIQHFGLHIRRARNFEIARTRIDNFLKQHEKLPKYLTQTDARKILYESEITLDADMIEAVIDICAETHGMLSTCKLKEMLSQLKFSSNDVSYEELAELLFRDTVNKFGVEVTRHQIKMFMKIYADKPDVALKDDIKEWLNKIDIWLDKDTVGNILDCLSFDGDSCNFKEFKRLLNKIVIKLDKV